MLSIDMAMTPDPRARVPGLQRTCPTWSSSAGVSPASPPRGASRTRTFGSPSSTSTTSTRSCRCSTRSPPPCSSRPRWPTRSARSSARPDNVGFRHAKVREVDHARNVVVLEDGSEIAFDHLVVATGATAAFFGIPGASQFAMPLYSLADARSCATVCCISLEEADAQRRHVADLAQLRHRRRRTDRRRDLGRALRADPHRHQARRPSHRPVEGRA